MNKDVIYRQDAIDTIDKYIAGFDAIDANFLDGLKTAKQLIKDLFSVIPEPCEDAISRQDAIDAIKNTYGLSYIEDGFNRQDAVSILKNLPSAQQEPVCINLNEPIKVKLTDWGKEIYYHQYDRTNKIVGREVCKPKFPKEDENGYTEFQLWCFIELYGMHMGMTLPNVIEPLEIVYEK